MDLIQKLFLSVSLVLVLYFGDVHGDDNTKFKVTDFGAIPDGKTDSTNAFLQAWSKACSTDKGRLLVPEGTFLIEKASFEGPCEGKTFFQLKGDLVAPENTGQDNNYWIQFYKIDGLKLSGRHTFDGKGASAWPYNKCRTSSRCILPHANIGISHLTNSKIVNIKSMNSKGFHFQMADSSNILMKNIQISAPDDSPNTDGIHIGRSSYVKIINSTISTGDDCVSLGDGNTNINITGVHCGPGHGISIGSLGKQEDEHDVKGITISDCTFTRTQNGLRIKTWAPSTNSIVVSDITFSHITVEDVQNPIIIDQHYCPHNQCDPSGESGIQIQNVKFIDIKGTSATDVAVNLQCSKAKPCQGIELQDLDLKLHGSEQPTKATCLNAGSTFVGQQGVPASC